MARQFGYRQHSNIRIDRVAVAALALVNSDLIPNLYKSFSVYLCVLCGKSSCFSLCLRVCGVGAKCLAYRRQTGHSFTVLYLWIRPLLC